MKPLAIIAALALTGCTSLEYKQEAAAPGERCKIRLTSSLGSGDIRLTGLQYNRFLDTGCAIIWDGPMVSADAFYAPAAVIKSDGCYTEDASWLPHAASIGGLIPYEFATAWLVERILPDPFKTRFENSFHRYNWITVAFYSNAEIRAMWPEYACEVKS